MALTTATTALAIPGHIGRAVGPLRAWIRVKDSYSRALALRSYLSITLGSNYAYRGDIGSPFLQYVNAGIRALRYGPYSPMFTDPGHVHLLWNGPDWPK